MNTKFKIKKNFTEGPIFFRILFFAVPIMLTGLLQLCYNMADNMVVGRFSGDSLALAAVGCTSSFNNLIINLLLGVAAGTGVVVAQLYGADEHRLLDRTIHTMLVFSFFAGIAFSGIGILISKPILTAMGTKPEVLSRAVLYMRIICLGIPASAVYNFGASVCRAVGNSKVPLAILGTSGLVNVILNIVFVVFCGMTVDGVAFATITSQYLSAAAVIYYLSCQKNESYAISLKRLCFDKRLLSRVLRYGIPSGIQSSMFSISNMLITSAINTFPTTTVSANTIASNIDSIAYTTMNSFSQAAMTFTGQNWGAGKTDRMRRVYWYTFIWVSIFGIGVGQLARLFVVPLSSLYIDGANPDAAEITAVVIEITTIILTTYFLCGIMDIQSGFLRGMGYSFTPMITSLVSICVVRIIWIYCVFFPIEKMNTRFGLYVSYPVSWGLAAIAFGILSVGAFRKLRRFDEARKKKAEQNSALAGAVAQ